MSELIEKARLTRYTIPPFLAASKTHKTKRKEEKPSSQPPCIHSNEKRKEGYCKMRRKFD